MPVSPSGNCLSTSARIGCDVCPRPDGSSCGVRVGTGFLYVRRDLIDQIEPPFLDLHAAAWTTRDTYEIRPDARRFENWEANYAAKIGLGVAIDYAQSCGLEAIETRVVGLAERLRGLLSNVDGVGVHDLGQRRCGIVSFAVDGVPAQQVKQHLSERGVNVSVSLVDYARLDLPSRALPDLVRASVHYYNTDDELDQLINALATIH